MKILHVYKHCYPETYGGVESVIYHLTRGLTQLGVSSDVATTTRAADFHVRQMGDSQVYCYPSSLEVASCPMSWRFYRDFARLANQYDLIHYQYPWPFADIVHYLSGIQKPTVISYQSDIVRQRLLKPFYLPLAHRFFAGADAIVATSENILKSSDTLHRYRDKTHIIPIGIDQECYPAPTPELMDKWRNKVGEGFCLFFGVLRYYKGLTLLLEAVRDSDIPVVIAGSGPERQRLSAMAQAYGLTNVHFTGRVDEDDKIALFNLSRCVVAPSHLRSESFCISLLEGLIFGKPLISTEIGTGTSFVNRHQVTGLVVPPNDARALRQAIEQLMNDEACYARMQAGVAEHYQRYFTGKAMAASHLNLYQEVLRQRQSRDHSPQC
jgi:glycosyltransferase involved in cell wall biosynthesis